MRKLSAAVILGIGLVLLRAFLALALPRPPRVTRANFERVKAGMSRADVEVVLGPPGDYTTGPTFIRCGGYVWVPPPYTSAERWEGDEGLAFVCFDPADRVIGSFMYPADLVEENATRKLLWRLERRWKALTR
jgi:hypothetical protein